MHNTKITPLHRNDPRRKLSPLWLYDLGSHLIPAVVFGLWWLGVPDVWIMMGLAYLVGRGAHDLQRARIITDARIDRLEDLHADEITDVDWSAWSYQRNKVTKAADAAPYEVCAEGNGYQIENKFTRVPLGKYYARDHADEACKQMNAEALARPEG